MSTALCIAALGGAVLASLPGPLVTLSWTHSVEKTQWREVWRVGEGLLHPVEARVKGTGAGMEPGPDARLRDGWLVWVPNLPPQERILLAASAFTGDHRLCAGGECRALSGWTGPRADGPVELRACRAGEAPARP
ncbi:DUF1850 domain-containing protein [Azospirillum thermophilum]|uniref:DUF1850 domain-containing protein n=1 Tax=Azospirillum thermophilum TaxID=2202148 RepID=A0A2S2CR81_9PROT|nr:DUF1850 domain-containing protein [Azospirillum thermophilum]AWK86992.1 DUF1850 domain-containing protein [Azospirillum thermophilum]